MIINSEFARIKKKAAVIYFNIIPDFARTDSTKPFRQQSQ